MSSIKKEAQHGSTGSTGSTIIGSSTLTNPTLTPTDRAGGSGAAPNLLKFFNICYSKVAIPCPQSASCDMQRESSEQRSVEDFFYFRVLSAVNTFFDNTIITYESSSFVRR